MIYNLYKNYIIKMLKNNKLIIKNIHGDIMFKNMKFFHQKNFNFKDGKKQNINLVYIIHHMMIFNIYL